MPASFDMQFASRCNKKVGIKDKAKCSETETKANKRTQNKKVQFVHSYKIEKNRGCDNKRKKSFAVTWLRF